MDKEIRASYTVDTIRVYQAYNKAIADEAVKKEHLETVLN